MPYRTVSELPGSVRDHVPEHAQEIYKEAFNSAWDQYKDPDDRRGDATREEVSHRVAWAASLVGLGFVLAIVSGAA